MLVVSDGLENVIEIFSSMRQYVKKTFQFTNFFLAKNTLRNCKTLQLFINVYLKMN